MSELSEPALARLTAESEIGRTLARYCHTIDDGDLEGLGACFAPDAELNAFGRTRNGRDAITALLAKAVPPENRRKHLSSNVVIAIAAPDADGEPRASVLSDFLFIAKDGSMITGRYVDEFVRLADGWVIAKRAIEINGS
jgi:hypothetical protein